MPSAEVLALFCLRGSIWLRHEPNTFKGNNRKETSVRGLAVRVIVAIILAHLPLRLHRDRLSGFGSVDFVGSSIARLERAVHPAVPH